MFAPGRASAFSRYTGVDDFVAVAASEHFKRALLGVIHLRNL
jgi:hypothetical protein